MRAGSSGASASTTVARAAGANAVLPAASGSRLSPGFAACGQPDSQVTIGAKNGLSGSGNSEARHEKILEGEDIFATGCENIANRREVFPTVEESLASVREMTAPVGEKLAKVEKFFQPRAENFSIVEEKFATVGDSFLTI
ncbi:MAG: hypothetical protein ACREMY_20210 [bacterium]